MEDKKKDKSPISDLLPPAFRGKLQEIRRIPQVESVYSGFSSYFKNLSSVTTVDQFLALNQEESGSPVLNLDKVATSLAFGYCSGFAARKSLQFGAFICGTGFIGLQILNYYGYLNINWTKISGQLTEKMDLNKDGKIDQKDLAIARSHVMKVLSVGLPNLGAFSLGMYFGMRR